MKILERFTRWVKADPVIVGGFLLTLAAIPVAVFGLKDDLVRAGHEFESRAHQCDRLASDPQALQSSLANPAAAIRACHEALERSTGRAGVRATTRLSGQ